MVKLIRRLTRTSWSRKRKGGGNINEQAQGTVESKKLHNVRAQSIIQITKNREKLLSNYKMKVISRNVYRMVSKIIEIQETIDNENNPDTICIQDVPKSNQNELHKLCRTIAREYTTIDHISSNNQDTGP